MTEQVALNSRKVCVFWQKVGKCRYGDNCEDIHGESPGRINFGVCLKWLKGITVCQHGEHCIREHLIPNEYSRNPCPDYVAGFCKLGWKCQNGHHCPLQAAAALSDRGICPPIYMKAQITMADKLWGHELDNSPIRTLKFLSVVRETLKLLSNMGSGTARSLSEMIASYAIEPDLGVTWSPQNCNLFMDAKVVSSPGIINVASWNFPLDKYNNKVACSLCRHMMSDYGHFLFREGKEDSLALVCAKCNWTELRPYSDDEVNGYWHWNEGIPTPLCSEAATELLGLPKCTNVPFHVRDRHYNLNPNRCFDISVFGLTVLLAFTDRCVLNGPCYR